MRLSDKAYYLGGIVPKFVMYKKEDVKQFIKDLKEGIIKRCGNRDLEFGEHPPLCEQCIEDIGAIDEKAGEGLI